MLSLGPDNPARGLVDDDDYSTGFGVWSGTSFAAPAFAADVAQQLVTAAKSSGKALPDPDVKDAVDHALKDTRDNRRFDANGVS